jgi:hypothetical protein
LIWWAKHPWQSYHLAGFTSDIASNLLPNVYTRRLEDFTQFSLAGTTA